VRFDVLTLFPELFAPFLGVGVTRRAYAEGRVDLRCWQLRDHASDTYRRVDDRPYGGGPGMVMLVEPLERALAAVRADRAAGAGDAAPVAPVILFSPAGAPLTQRRVEQLAAGPGAILLCGRYEGVDQRFVDRHVDEEISLGDFVLSGGELPALALLDAVARLQPGVLHDAASHQQDSHSDGLLDCPHYSRPETLGDAVVPPVLLGGNHAEIARWRRTRQLEITARRRPDLLARARQEGRISATDEKILDSLGL
jgi:tRNA (guanine37-N1)-methyltransferase